MAGRPITVLACEPQPVVVDGLRKTLEPYEEFRFAGAARGMPEALEAIRALDPDVVLLDHDADREAAARLIEEIRKAGARAGVVLWAHWLEEPERERMLRLGARGILRKDTRIEALLQCLRVAAAGGRWVDEAVAETQRHPERPRQRRPRLTPREREVLALVAAGMRNNEIARALSVAPGTVKVHLMHLFEKTGAGDRFELAIRSRKLLDGDG